METKSNEIISTRVFDFPREQVFKAWAEPEYLAQWWGPNGFTNTFQQFDFRAGGDWVFTMHSPDGANYDNKNIFDQIIIPELIVFDHVEPQQHLFTGTYKFEHLHGKTKVTFTMAHRTAEETENLRPFIEPANEQNFDRLQTVLESMPRNTELIFTRLLNAPRELVFEVWTNPEHVIKWWGPNGFTNTIHRMNARTGGDWKYIMHGPDGRDYDNYIEYLEVIKPEKLYYLHSEKEGDLGSFKGLVTFEEAEGNKTRLTMRLIFNTADELEYVVREFGAADGGNQTLAKMENYLQTL